MKDAGGSIFSTPIAIQGACGRFGMVINNVVVVLFQHCHMYRVSEQKAIPTSIFKNMKPNLIA